jgi:cell fate regulator YaaT (PSP1 superfamily)
MSQANQQSKESKSTDTTKTSKWQKVQFRVGEQIFTASSSIKDLNPQDPVMVVTDHGLEPARLIGNGLPAPIGDHFTELQPAFTIQRRANQEDQDKYCRLLEREDEAYQTCKDFIKRHKLKMKLIRVERFYNGSKIIFYFTADNRVDFRALVKDLVQEFRTRVEMRQVGVRHETKMIGGIGSCGRELCCASYLDNFAPVSIKMAKEQSLPLNPTKISGICNRLLCCLTYEFPVYREIRRSMPRCGKNITLDNKPFRVIKQNILEESVTVIDIKDRDIVLDIPREEWEPALKKHPQPKQKKPAEKNKKSRVKKK